MSRAAVDLSPDRILQTLYNGGHVGMGNGLHVHELASAAGAPGDVHDTAAEREVRRCIMELRLKGIPICGRPDTGYFVGQTADELNDTCRFLVDRAMTSLRQAAALKRLTLPDLYGQLKIPT